MSKYNLKSSVIIFIIFIITLSTSRTIINSPVNG